MKNARSLSKKMAIAFTVALSVVLFSCGEKKEEGMVAPEGMHVLDLSKYGKPFALFVPDTVSAKLTITEQSNGALDIMVGKNFAVSINEQAADLELIKSDVKSDEVNKLAAFITDEPGALLWESAITEPEFHFVLNQKIGGADYSFEDIRNLNEKGFSKQAIQKMFDSAKTIKEIKKAQ
mgnify:CR=1 FL=1